MKLKKKRISVLIHQISWMKNIQSKFQIVTWPWNIFAVSFSFGVLAYRIVVIYFVTSSFTSTNNSLKNSGIILK